MQLKINPVNLISNILYTAGVLGILATLLITVVLFTSAPLIVVMVNLISQIFFFAPYFYLGWHIRKLRSTKIAYATEQFLRASIYINFVAFIILGIGGIHYSNGFILSFIQTILLILLVSFRKSFKNDLEPRKFLNNKYELIPVLSFFIAFLLQIYLLIQQIP